MFGEDGMNNNTENVENIIKNEENTEFKADSENNTAHEDEVKAENLMSYLKTKFCRFLLLQAVSSINLSKDKFIFVPLQDFSKPWTDEELYQKYNLEKDEIDFINSMIRPME